jgi:hypothetical protein
MKDNYYKGGAAPGPSQPHTAPPPRQQQQQPRPAQWQTHTREQQPQRKKAPKPPPASTAPVAPAEVVQVNEALLAMQREREQLRRKMQMHVDEEASSKAQPIGRCCLNRGLTDAAHWCHKDRLHALVRARGVRQAAAAHTAVQLRWAVQP